MDRGTLSHPNPCASSSADASSSILVHPSLLTDALYSNHDGRLHMHMHFQPNMQHRTACPTHTSELLRWIGTSGKFRRLRCRQCTSAATRAWRQANPWRRVWQSLVQRARRKFAIPVSWRQVGERSVLACVNHAFAIDVASIGELHTAVSDSMSETCPRHSHWVMTWQPGCTRWSLDQLRLVPLTRNHDTSGKRLSALSHVQCTNSTVG